MRLLPLAALGLDDEIRQWLLDLGLRTCGQLQKLPRRALGVRLGARTHDVMQLLDGEDFAPLDAWRPPAIPEERIELEWGVSSVEALGFVIKKLCDRISTRLEGRATATSRFELVFTLDRALCKTAANSSTLELALPVPIWRAADLLAVARARLERHTLEATVLAVTFRATGLERTTSHTLDLLSEEPKAKLALPRLTAEITAEFGDGCVGTLALSDTWIPSDRTYLLPFGAERPKPRHGLVTSALEPTRLVPSFRLEREEVVGRAQCLARIEAVQWWRRGVERRDLVAAFLPVESHARTKGLAWIELHYRKGDAGDAQLRGWID
jgi:protein ImuB